MLEAFPPANRFAFFVLLAFGCSVFFARALTPIALRIGLADAPGGRKQHTGTIPVTGGLAMFFGFAAATLASKLAVGAILALLTAQAVLVAGGAADDMRDITPRTKFLLQLVAALFMTSWAQIQVLHLGELLGVGPINLYQWAIPFSVVCCLGLINAVNMVDGIDGAAGGITFLAALLLAVAAGLQGLAVQCVLLLLLASAIAGFLVWNMRLPGRSHAAVFMGDAGSMMLGFTLCWFAIDLTQGVGRSMPPIAAVWVLAVPLLDMARVMFVRALRGASLFSGDREHFHHLLLAKGWGAGRIAAALAAISAACGAIGLGAWRLHVPDWAMLVGFLGVLCVVLAAAWTREVETPEEKS
jgi:UDP-GlcNAc:undecaprenyl-phosphate GlcNAc-1-phosphate transferase